MRPVDPNSKLESQMNTKKNRLLTGDATRSVLILCTASLTWAGCDSLDVTDPNAPNADDVTIQSLVSGTEGALRVGLGNYLQVVGIFGREAYYFEPADPRYTGELFEGPLDPGGFLLENPWEGRYAAIQNALILLQRGAELGGGAQSAVEGYVNTVVAYQLLLMLNYLDEEGIKIEFNDDVNTPFVSKSEAFAEIKRRLDDGLSSLQSAGSSFPFQLSSGFSGFDTPASFARFNRALRARVAIYEQDYSGALTALEASFLNAAGDPDTGVYHTYGTGSGDRLNPIFEVPSASFVKLRAHRDLQSQAEPGDLRFSEKILDRSADLDPSPGSANGLISALVVTVSSSSTDRFPIIRNEELLLIRAEASIGLGSLGAAESDINTVRSWAGLGSVTLNTSNAIDRLLHERMYSLFMEGHRWIDMRRYGRLLSLPRDMIGETGNMTPGLICFRMPRPQDEVPQGQGSNVESLCQ